MEEEVDKEGMAATRPELPDALLFLKQVRGPACARMRLLHEGCVDCAGWSGASV